MKRSVLLFIALIAYVVMTVFMLRVFVRALIIDTAREIAEDYIKAHQEPGQPLDQE